MYLPVECVAIVQPVGVPVRVMWQLGSNTSPVPAGIEDPRGVRLEAAWNRGSEWPVLSVDNSSWPYCRYGVGYCLARRENCFQQSQRSAGLSGIGLHPQSVNL